MPGWAYTDGAVADIVLTTLNARYAHASFGLRYLLANLPPALRERATMLEFDVSQRSVDVLEAILAHQPRIVGVGAYIWNADESARLVASELFTTNEKVSVDGPVGAVKVGLTAWELERVTAAPPV